jgi:hypothetical protein
MNLEQISIMRMGQEGKSLTDILTLELRTVPKLMKMRRLLKTVMVQLVDTLLMHKDNKFPKTQ